MLAIVLIRTTDWMGTQLILHFDGLTQFCWQVLEAPQKVRAAASAVAIAMVVHRTMSWLGPAEPLGAVVPVLLLIACVVIWALAVPIAREWERLGR